MNQGFFGMGQEVAAFEKELSTYFGRQAVCVVNGTAALHLALQALDLTSGDEVLVQSLTYVASFQAISAAGATPVACDVNPASLTLDLNDAERKITSRTKAIMPVHYAGGVGDLDALYALAEKYSLRVVEDAAHAMGSFYNQAKVGSRGDIACFSFDGIKNITSGEGGCVVTDDPNVISAVQDARLLGVVGDSIKRANGGRTWEPNVQAQGWRYHMSDLMAAIGRVQLGRLSELALKRKELAQLYCSILKENKDLTLLNLNYREVVPHIFPVVCREESQRQRVREVLSQEGVPYGLHYTPNHLLDYFKASDTRLPNTEDIFTRIITLPLHPDITEKQVKVISSIFLNACN
jgi:dTDP-4-amino-4,6-dideoxygalactose transaminase